MRQDNKKCGNPKPHQSCPAFSKREYYKTEICGSSYLLSYGQASATGGAVLRLNESGSLLWDGILQGLDQDGLTALLAKNYQADAEDFPVLRQDVEDFLRLLYTHGILVRAAEPAPHTADLRTAPLSPALTPTQSTSDFHAAGADVTTVCDSGAVSLSPDSSTDERALRAASAMPDFHAASVPDSPARTFRIGTLTVSCQGADRLCEQYFKAFYCTPAPTDLQITVYGHAPLKTEGGHPLLRTRELTLFDCEAFYRFRFSENWFIHEMQVKKDGQAAAVYCSSSCPEEHTDALFHAIRFAFLTAAQGKGLFALHSASLLYRGRAWLFSGCSGTGKSTHTALWKEQLQTPLLNGDLNLLGIRNGVPTAYGLPWCGTSGIYTPENYPLGGIIFLKQAPHNRVSRLSHEKAALSLFQRLISPTWTETLTAENLSFSTLLCGQLPCFELECTKEAEAAHVMREAIDALFQNTPSPGSARR